MMTLLLCVAAFLLFIWIGRTEDAKKAKRITQHPQEPLLSDYVVDEVLKEPVILILNDKPKKLSLEVSFVAIDFETANRRRGSACAIGMCKIDTRNIYAPCRLNLKA
jgi:hypothetical protein